MHNRVGHGTVAASVRAHLSAGTVHAACIGGECESDTDPARRLRNGGSCDSQSAPKTEHASRNPLNSPQSPTFSRVSAQATHPRLRLRSMCAANWLPRGRGRPTRTRGASAEWASEPKTMVAGRSTMRSAGARTRRWTPFAGTAVHRPGHRRHTRTLGRGNYSHFAGAGSGVRAMTLNKKFFASAQGGAEQRG